MKQLLHLLFNLTGNEKTSASSRPDVDVVYGNDPITADDNSEWITLGRYVDITLFPKWVNGGFDTSLGPRFLCDAL